MQASEDKHRRRGPEQTFSALASPAEVYSHVLELHGGGIGVSLFQHSKIH